jgi:hypothetical protein
MRWTAVPLTLLLFSTLACAGVAGTASIDPNKLPIDPEVRDLYLDLRNLEPMVLQWTPQWKYDLPKADVAATLKSTTARLEQARAESPDNEELALLAGLAAHYAYNVDVEGSYTAADRAYQAARQIAPDDFRPDWFLAVHQCQSGDELDEGMRRFLANESRFHWDTLPPEFWDDYLACALVNRMPAHALRAAAHLRAMGAAPDDMRDLRVHQAKKLLVEPSHTPAQDVGEIWEGRKLGGHPVLVSSLCALSFGVQGDWKVGLSKMKDSCTVQIETGPYPGPSGDVFPNVLVIAQAANPGETLFDFVTRILDTQPVSKPVPAARCPADECLAYHIITPGQYKDAGDGHVLLVAFQREQPEFPGTRFEEPTPPPRDQKTGDAAYFVSRPRLGRIPGTVYYLVVLDTADTVLEKAKADFEFVLKDFEVE